MTLPLITTLKIIDFESNNSSLGNNLKMKFQEQEQPSKNINGNLDQLMLNFDELNENSKHIVQNTFSLMKKILNSLNNFSKDMKILLYIW